MFGANIGALQFALEPLIRTRGERDENGAVNLAYSDWLDAAKRMYTDT
jgi:hypothetical protein